MLSLRVVGKSRVLSNEKNFRVARMLSAKPICWKSNLNNEDYGGG